MEHPVGRNLSNHGRKATRTVALVDDKRILVALSRHCGDVTHGQLRWRFRMHKSHFVVYMTMKMKLINLGQ